MNQQNFLARCCIAAALAEKILASDAQSPKPLSDSTKLAIAKAQRDNAMLAVRTAEIQREIDERSAANAKAMSEAMDKARKESGAGPECALDLDFNWKCEVKK